MSDTTENVIDLSAITPQDWIDYLNQGGTLADAINMDEQQLESIYSVAYGMYQAGNYKDAHTLFVLLCHCDHYEPRFCYGLGAARLALKQYNEAGDAFSFGSIIHPTDPRFAFQTAHCHLALQQWREAGMAFETAEQVSREQNSHPEIQQESQAQICMLAKKLNITIPENEETTL